MTGGWWILAALALVAWLFRRSKRPTAGTPSVTTAPSRQPERLITSEVPATRSPAPRRTPKPVVRWIAPGEACSVQTFNIPGGMIYVESIPRMQRYSLDRNQAHILDPDAPVDHRNPDLAGQSMAYWPSYSEITPQARAGYLQWLAGGRRDPNAGIGHVFLFFYGLEHRLFTEGAWQDAPVLLAEVEALLAVYGGQSSFRGYAARFVDAVRLSTNTVPEDAPRELLPRSYELPLGLQLGLSRQLSQGHLPGDWLLAWYVAHPETQLRTPATRCFDEFRQLFLLRFAGQYPLGLAVRTPAKKLKLYYRPASGTAQITLKGPGTGLPDPTALAAPLKLAATLAADCTTALDSYSRFLGRHPNKRNTLAAVLLMPSELRGAAMSMLDEVRAKLQSMTPTGIHETTVGALSSELGLDIPATRKPSPTDLNQLSLGLQALGFGMEPDPRFGGKIAGANTAVLLFRARDGASIDPTRPAYVAARMLIEIAAVAATIDSENIVPGLGRVEAEIGHLSELTTDERLRLYAYLASFRRTTPNPRQVLGKLSALTQSQRERIARVALGALLANRRIGPDEVAFAEKLYKALALPDQQLYSDIHAATGGAVSRELPRVAEAEPARRGTPIPPRPAATTRTIPKTARPPVTQPFTLDPQRLAEQRRASETLRERLGRDSAGEDEPPAALSTGVPAASMPEVAPPPPVSPLDASALDRIRQETDAVRTLLSGVFADPEEETSRTDSSTTTKVAATASQPRFTGLDDDHSAVIDLLIARQGTISRQELEHEFSRRGMFFDGALETINDWAFDRFDEQLIEEGETCTVPRHLLEKLLDTPEAA